MKAITYLQFAGNATEALSFYEKALSASEVKAVKFGIMPDSQLSEEEKNMVMDSYIRFGNNVIMLSDVPPSMEQAMGKVIPGSNMLISIIDGDEKTNAKYFSRLSEGGNVIMPLASYPWSKNFGMLVDKFGITWKFNGDAISFIDSINK